MIVLCPHHAKTFDSSIQQYFRGINRNNVTMHPMAQYSIKTIIISYRDKKPVTNDNGLVYKHESLQTKCLAEYGIMEG